MKEKLITFETAKLAKEKGFDWIVRNNYSEYMDAERRLEHHNISYDFNHNHSIKIYSAPTQSLLQKWLREVHKIDVDVASYFSLTKYCLKIHTYEEGEYVGTVLDTTRRKDHNGQNIKQLFFNTYEEALEKGLQEALKLIKL